MSGQGSLRDNSVPPPGRLVFAERDFAVVMKLPGEICEDSDEAASLPRAARPLLEDFFGRGPRFCQCVHRLDRPVSGLCVLALSPASCAALSAVFSAGKARKTYLAVTEKPASFPSDACTELSGWIRFDRKRRRSFMVPEGTPGAKQAELGFRVTGEGDRYLFVRAEPRTGRTHQIRCQLSAAGLPIKGDVKYGARRTERGGGIRLHAWALSFPHPGTGIRQEFRAPPPCMDALWAACLSSAEGLGDGGGT